MNSDVERQRPTIHINISYNTEAVTFNHFYLTKNSRLFHRVHTILHRGTSVNITVTYIGSQIFLLLILSTDQLC